jgi:SpoIIAA-like
VDRAQMIELIEGLPSNVVGIAVRGRVTAQECREILTPAIEKSLKWRAKIRLYYELGSRFPGSGWDDLDIGFEHASRCERIAIVTDIAWVRLTVKAIRFVIPGQIRVFGTIETAAARAWISARPGSRADTGAALPGRACGTRPQRAPRPAPQWSRKPAASSQKTGEAVPGLASPE